MFKTTLKKKSSINIIPMIDVIFFLLVFFMLFTTFRTSPSGIDLELPKASTVTDQKAENMIIDVDEEGQIFYDGNSITLSELKKKARELYNNNSEITAIINADRDVQYRHIVNVMDNLRQAGMYKLALAADKKE